MILNINLGAGKDIIKGFQNVDVVPSDGIDIVTDLNVTPWPWKNQSVDRIYASHVFEHLYSIQNVMRECARILRFGGRLTIYVPHWRNESAWTDSSHVHYFTPKTLDYWCQGTELNKKFDHQYKPWFSKFRVIVCRPTPRFLAKNPERFQWIFPPSEIRFSLIRNNFEWW